MSASAVLIAAAQAAFTGAAGLNRGYDGPPLRASLPYATVEVGPECDWSWKDGVGRELRLAVAVRDAGERPERLRGLMDGVETALAGIDDETGEWRVTSCPVRARAGGEGRAGGGSGWWSFGYEWQGCNAPQFT